MSIENESVVEAIITLLNGIDVDGETMEYIINEVGMRDQMYKQLISDKESDESIKTNQLYPVYKCDDYDFNDGVLTIYGGVLVAEIKNITEWSTITSMISYDAMICPSMYEDEKGNKVNIVIFK